LVIGCARSSEMAAVAHSTGRASRQPWRPRPSARADHAFSLREACEAAHHRAAGHRAEHTAGRRSTACRGSLSPRRRERSTAGHGPLRFAFRPGFTPRGSIGRVSACRRLRCACCRGARARLPLGARGDGAAHGEHAAVHAGTNGACVYVRLRAATVRTTADCSRVGCAACLRSAASRPACSSLAVGGARPFSRRSPAADANRDAVVSRGAAGARSGGSSRS